MAPICRATDFETPLNVPWMVTVPAVPDATDALNDARVPPAGTTTKVGVLTPELLLVTRIPNPPAGDSPVVLTAQEAVPGAASEEGLHASEVNAGGEAVPVPLRLIAVVLWVKELLVIVTWPVAGPVTVGLNPTRRVAA